jgi:Cys-rich protein (TIGR01571 family)
LHPSRRRLLREKYHLAEEPCGDCFASCCMCCAMIQEMREMELRGAPTSASMPNN